MKHNNIILVSIIALSLIASISSISLRIQNQQHDQINTFAEVINNSAHKPSDTRMTNSSSSVNTGLIIAIICIGLCVLCCCSCCCLGYRQARKEQQKTSKALQENIPCFCAPCQLALAPYTLLINLLLRIGGYDVQTFQKKPGKQQKMKQQENPYEVNKNPPLINVWYQSPIARLNSTQPAQSYRVKHSKCNICKGKQKGHSNCASNCAKGCAFHMECLIKQKNKDKKSSNKCINCKQKNYNKIRFYCKKCWQKYTQISTQNGGSVYGTNELNYQEILKSINNGKCDICVNKKWFWQ